MVESAVDYVFASAKAVHRAAEAAFFILIIGRKANSLGQKVFPSDNFNAYPLLRFQNHRLIHIGPQDTDRTANNMTNILHDHDIDLISLQCSARDRRQLMHDDGGGIYAACGS